MSQFQAMASGSLCIAIVATCCPWGHGDKEIYKEPVRHNGAVEKWPGQEISGTGIYHTHGVSWGDISLGNNHKIEKK